MNYIFIFTLCILSAFSGLANNNDAVEYNDKIVNEQTKIGEAILAFSNNPNNFSLSLIKEQAEKSQDVLKQMKPFEGNKQFLAAAKALFKFYADITNKEYKKILEIIEDKDKYSPSDITAKINELSNSISKREVPLDKAFEDAQVEFAKKYNFSLRKNDFSDKIEKAIEE